MSGKLKHKTMVSGKNTQPEWLQELCQGDVLYILPVLPLHREDVRSADEAKSSNACLGSPPAHLPDHAPSVPDVPDVVAVASVSHGQHATKLKRKWSPRGSPPRKFAFAAQKPELMEL